MSGRWIRFLGFLNAVLAIVFPWAHARADDLSWCSGFSAPSNPWNYVTGCQATGVIKYYDTLVDSEISGVSSYGANYRIWHTPRDTSKCDYHSDTLYRIPNKGNVASLFRGYMNSNIYKYCQTTGCYQTADYIYCKDNYYVAAEKCVPSGSATTSAPCVYDIVPTDQVDVLWAQVAYGEPYGIELLGCADGFYPHVRLTNSHFQHMSGTTGATGSSGSTGLTGYIPLTLDQVLTTVQTIFPGYCYPCPGMPTTEWDYTLVNSGVLPTGNGMHWYADASPKYYDMRDCRAAPLATSGGNIHAGTDDSGTFELVATDECTYTVD